MATKKTWHMPNATSSSLLLFLSRTSQPIHDPDRETRVAFAIAEKVGVQQVQLRPACPVRIEVVVRSAAKHPGKRPVAGAGNSGGAHAGVATPKKQVTKHVERLIRGSPGHPRSEIVVIKIGVHG